MNKSSTKTPTQHASNNRGRTGYHVQKKLKSYYLGYKAFMGDALSYINKLLIKPNKAPPKEISDKLVFFFFFFKAIQLGIFRSDYMIDTTGGLHDQCCGCCGSSNTSANSIYIKQVEMNTISLGGISFSCLVPDMHR